MKELAGLAASIVLFLSGCVGVAEEKDLGDGFYLSAFDVEEQMEIIAVDSSGYAYVAVPATVYSVGYDRHSIIAKQSPAGRGSSARKAPNYYIIFPKQRPRLGISHNVIGPLSRSEFELRKRRLGITIDFTLTLQQ